MREKYSRECSARRGNYRRRRRTSAVVERSNANGMATKRPPCAITSAAPAVVCRRVVAALDQDVRHRRDDQLARRVAVERNDEIDRRERRQDRHAIVLRVERTFVAFAETLDRRIGIDRDDERCAETSRLLRDR